MDIDRSELSDIFAYLSEIKNSILELESRVIRQADVQESWETNELYGALSLAQGAYPHITMNRKDGYWGNEYADLDLILHAVRPMLRDNNLGVLQQLRLVDGVTVLHTRLTHKSGQWIESRTRIVPPRDDTETYTSLLNHQKRNAVMALLGVTINNDKYDDNGDWAMKSQRVYTEKGTATNYAEKKSESDTVTKEQVEELQYELSEFPDLAQQLFTQLKIESLADMPKSQYMKSIQKIREIKLLRKK